VREPNGVPYSVPQTLKEVKLRDRIRAAGGLSLKEAGDFFGWEPAQITKDVDAFTKEVLLANGWTKEHLLDVANAYDHIARITPNNPSAAGRAAQFRALAELHD